MRHQSDGCWSCVMMQIIPPSGPTSFFCASTAEPVRMRLCTALGMHACRCGAPAPNGRAPPLTPQRHYSASPHLPRSAPPPALDRTASTVGCRCRGSGSRRRLLGGRRLHDHVLRNRRLVFLLLPRQSCYSAILRTHRRYRRHAEWSAAARRAARAAPASTARKAAARGTKLACLGARVVVAARLWLSMRPSCWRDREATPVLVLTSEIVLPPLRTHQSR